MENFLAGRPSIAKLSVPPKITANLFASLANRTAPRTGGAPGPETHPGVSAEPAAEGASSAHEAQIELVREDGVVRRIVVVCQCGERTELDCVY